MKQKVILIAFAMFLFLSATAWAVEGGVGSEETSVQKLKELEEKIQRLERDHETRAASNLQQKASESVENQRIGVPHKGAPAGTYGGMMNPDISVIADVQSLFTDNKDNDLRNRVRVKHVELALQGYLYPGIRADVIPALEMEYHGDEVGVEVDLEEACITASQIPYLSEYVPLELRAGRTLMSFGRLNPVHPHHWPFVDTPLAMANFFGEHSWFDDGIQASLVVPNPWDMYLKTAFGIWNGRQLGHHHGEEEHEGEEEHSHHHNHTIAWNGHVYLSRIVLGIPFGRVAHTLLGYSAAWDETRDTLVQGADLTFVYHFSGTYRRIRWQNEFFAPDNEETGRTRYGGYSLLQLTLTKYWELGCRYDHSQVLDADDDGDEWAGSGFVSYYLTHSAYIRGQYRYRKMLDDTEEHNGYVQLVFGLGPHSHRLED